MTKSSVIGFSYLAAIASISFFAPLAAAQVTASAPSQTSVGLNSAAPDGTSGSPALPLNGGYLSFNSNADNLVVGDLNNSADIFLRNLGSGSLSRVSVSTAGVEGDDDSTNPAVSPVAPGGFYAVAFQSFASNLSTTTDTLNFQDIFVRLPTLGVTEVISAASGPTLGNGDSSNPSITVVPGPNTVMIVFESEAENLVAGDSNNRSDIFLAKFKAPDTAATSIHSLTTVTKLSKAAAAGEEPDGDSHSPVISGNGRFVVYASDAANLITGATPVARQVYLYDIKTGTTKLISKDATGGPGNGDSDLPSISFNGRYIAYLTEASNITSDASSLRTALVLFDTKTNIARRVNTSSTGVAGDGRARDALLSGNARFVIFTDSSENLVSSDTNGEDDVFVKDLITGAISRISLDAQGVEGDGASDSASMAFSKYNGSSGRLAFRSSASNIDSAIPKSGSDLYLSTGNFGLLNLTPSTVLEVPADVALGKHSATLSMQEFKGTGSTATAVSDAPMTPVTATSSSISYQARINSVGNKSVVRQTITKKRKIAFRNLPAGTYKTSYRALTLRNGAVVKRSPYSPPIQFVLK